MGRGSHSPDSMVAPLRATGSRSLEQRDNSCSRIPVNRISLQRDFADTNLDKIHADSVNIAQYAFVSK